MNLFSNFIILLGVLIWVGLGCNLADMIFSLPFLITGILSGILTEALAPDIMPYVKIRKTFFILLQIFFTVPVLLFLCFGIIGILSKLDGFLFCIYTNAPFVLFILESICLLKARLWKKPKELILILISDPCLAALAAVVIVTVIASSRI